MSSKKESRLKNSADRRIIFIILFFAAIIGTVSVYEMHISPFSQSPILDEKSYVDWGMRIADGKLLNNKPFYQEALYPYFLGLCFFLFKKSLLAARFVQVGFWVLTVWFLFLTGRRLFGEKEGLLAASLFSLYGVMYLNVAVLIKSTIVVFTTTVFLYLLVSSRKEKFLHWLWLGFVIGLLTNLRGNFFLFIPFLFLWARFAERREEQSLLANTLRRSILLAVGIVLALLPTIVHNYIASGEFIATTSQGGANFYIGNHQFADGTMVMPYFVRAGPLWEADHFAAEAEKRTGHQMSPSETSRYWFKEGISFLINNPAAGAKLMMRKLQFLASDYEIPDNYSFRYMRRFIMHVLWIPFVSFGLLLGLAIVGMWLAWKENFFSRPLVLFAAVYSLSLLMFYVVSRYRVPLVPVVVLFAAFYTIKFIDDWKLKKLSRHIWTIFIVVLMSFLSFMPNNKSKDKDRIDAHYLKITGIVLFNQQKYQEALQYLRMSAMKNIDPDTMFVVGLVYEAVGRPDVAFQAYSETLKLHPGDQRAKNKIERLRKSYPDLHLGR
jgi:4-amino-4-deoxy-L-arabinose transferase-like glycosyltransferase